MPSTCDATAVAYVTASRSKYESWNHTDSRPSARARSAHVIVSSTSPRAARPRPTRRARLGMRQTSVERAERAVDASHRLILTEELERVEQRRAGLASGGRDAHGMR